jgi:hypothetical protein
MQFQMQIAGGVRQIETHHAAPRVPARVMRAISNAWPVA